MIRRNESKRLVISVLMGSAITAAIAYFSHQPGRHWFDGILWAGYLFGSFVSGNVHSPNPIAAWLMIAFGLSCVAYGAVAFVELVRGRRPRAPRAG